MQRQKDILDIVAPTLDNKNKNRNINQTTPSKMKTENKISYNCANDK